MIDANLNLKICGVTNIATAMYCAELGAGAVGAVFYEASPRFVSVQQAQANFRGLPEWVARVGVFVDMPADETVAIARKVGLDTVQMHGSESVGDMVAVMSAGFHVVKVLKTSGKKLLEEAARMPQAAGILVECGKGILPGGNGAVWEWADAAPLAGSRHFALAGGLTPANLKHAALSSKADAWDVSSGVEVAPGMKDMWAVAQVIAVAKKLAPCAENFWKGRSYAL